MGYDGILPVIGQAHPRNISYRSSGSTFAAASSSIIRNHLCRTIVDARRTLKPIGQPGAEVAKHISSRPLRLRNPVGNQREPSQLAAMQYRNPSDRRNSCPLLTAGLALKSLSSVSSLCAIRARSGVAVRIYVPLNLLTA